MKFTRVPNLDERRTTKATPSTGLPNPREITLAKTDLGIALFWEGYKSHTLGPMFNLDIPLPASRHCFFELLMFAAEHAGDVEKIWFDEPDPSKRIVIYMVCNWLGVLREAFTKTLEKQGPGAVLLPHCINVMKIPGSLPVANYEEFSRVDLGVVVGEMLEVYARYVYAFFRNTGVIGKEVKMRINLRVENEWIPQIKT